MTSETTQRAKQCENHDGIGCGCERGAEIMHVPTAIYTASRRDFLRKAVLSGAAVSLLPLLTMEEAHADIFMPSADDQKKQGDAAAAQILQKSKVVTDDRSRALDRVGGKLINALSNKERGTFDYRFHVIDSKDVNAFALPGGNLFIYTGLFDRLHSDNELAGVTGHEITHIRQQHWARAVASQTKRELLLEIGLSAAHAGKTWRDIAGGADSLLSLHYSRGEEDEADAKGLDDMVRAGYNPQGMLDLFNTLLQATGGKENGPGFLSDHPLTKDRIKRTQDRIAKLHR